MFASESKSELELQSKLELELELEFGCVCSDKPLATNDRISGRLIVCLQLTILRPKRAPPLPPLPPPPRAPNLIVRPRKPELARN